jgi:hypothetical protein
MEASADAFGRSFPRIEPFGVRIGLVTAAQDFGFDSGMNLVIALRFENAVFMLIEPPGKTPALLAREPHE